LKYIATLREQLEQLAEERTADELPRLVWFLNLFLCSWSFLGFVKFESFFFLIESRRRCWTIIRRRLRLLLLN
jgi:hypothetical protein